MALTPWEKTPAGVVAVNTQATLADVRLPNGTPIARTRAYIAKASRVRIIIEVDGVDTVSFDDTVTPAADSVVEVYNRTIFRESVKAEHVPPQPKAAVGEGIEP